MSTILPDGEFITEEQFLHLPRDGRRWELVAGKAKGTSTGCRKSAIMALIVYLLRHHTRRNGCMTNGRAGFQMSNGNIRVPDVSFTRKEHVRWCSDYDDFGAGAPDLCVEVISPSEEPSEMRDKVEEYFASGATIVWHVFPEDQRVVVFTSSMETTMLEAEDMLDGGDVVPGFSCRVSEFFDVD